MNTIVKLLIFTIVLYSCDSKKVNESGLNDLVVGVQQIVLYENSEFYLELGAGAKKGTYTVNGDTINLKYNNNSEGWPHQILSQEDYFITIPAANFEQRIKIKKIFNQSKKAFDERIDEVIDTTRDDERSSAPDKRVITNMDSLVNSLPINTIEEFDIDKIEIPKTRSLTNMNEDIYHQIHGNLDGYDSASPIYFLSRLESSSDSTLLFITYNYSIEGENIDGSPYIVHRFRLFNTLKNGHSLQILTLATQDNNVITYEITSRLTNDTLFTSEIFEKEATSNNDPLFTENNKFLISKKSMYLDTIYSKIKRETL